MRHALKILFAAVALAAPGLAALAAITELLPQPLPGWTASGGAYSESVITDEPGSESSGKRIEIMRDYTSGARGLRISLNTRDHRGTSLIHYVNEAQKQDPGAAAELQSKGIHPFSFKSHTGVTMKTDRKDEVTGAALRIGDHGTLTIEGIHDGGPAALPLADVEAYLARTDLKRMADFVHRANETPRLQPE